MAPGWLSSGDFADDSAPATVWVMNLLSGSERELPLPKGAGRPYGRLGSGWRLSDRGSSGALPDESAAGAGHPSRGEVARERTTAESSLAVLLGRPVFARVVPCQRPADLCVSGDSGTALLARDARDPVRWGDDSVAFFVGDELEIRPLARGRARRLVWSNPPERPREMTFFSGRRDR